MTLVYCARMLLPLLSVTMHGTKLAPQLKLNPRGGGFSGLPGMLGDNSSALMQTSCGICGTLAPTQQACEPAPHCPWVCSFWGTVSLLAVEQTLAPEDAVLAVTCKWHNTGGVAWVSWVGDGGRVGGSESSYQIWLSLATKAATSSSSLGAPLLCKALVIQMISSMFAIYSSLWWMVFQTHVMAKMVAWLTPGSSVNSTDAHILPCGWTWGLKLLRLWTEGAKFSWLESLSLLSEGLSGLSEVTLTSLLAPLVVKCMRWGSSYVHVVDLREELW